ncbi:MAG TPA: ATP-dependent zinc metalloprotease FtsH [Sedimentisphaerales bacterium]|jgi:cell division protease FtsH|nr:ATP-dependent zinc metalloprotease FtsH [Sedimentisphaerales bacterium]HNU29589.1 ATP-dependent zinc metalloprotease FtsH [Sedimentisphaerales bacterium]
MNDNASNSQNDSPRDAGKRPNKKPPLPGYPRGRFSWLIVAIVLITATMILQGGFVTNTLRWDEFTKYLDEGQIERIDIGESEISGKFREGAAAAEERKGRSFKVNYRPEAGAKERLNEKLADLGKRASDEPGFVMPTVEYTAPRIWMFMLLNWVLPVLFLVGFFYFFVFRNMRGGAGGMLMSFGRSKHRVHGKDRVKVTFKDVAGIEEAKDEVAEIIEFLKNPRKFQRLGGRIPRGVLLIGPPGCGKTLLAKAIAGEADVPFFSISGSDFVEMFVGVGASRVRDLFKQAKDNSPCIIFLDEVDAIGRKRGASFVGGGHDEREQTLNAILVEMDGFDTNDQVIVIAATNRADILDHALTRPGRFDRQVVVPLPDLKGRLEILRVHARKVKLSPSASLERLARGTPMFSGADLAAIINEAALAATMANKDYIEMADLEEGRDKVRWGRAKKSRVVDQKEREVIAYHEAGHTLVQSLIKDADPLHKVSIIPRGPMGGATFALPEKDRTLFTKRYCVALLQVCFGGRIAEQLFCDDISSGAQSDIEQATKIARQMVLTWGMSDHLGPVSYGPDQGVRDLEYIVPTEREYSEKTAEDIDAEVRLIMDEAYKRAKQVIEENREKVQGIAQALLKYETLDAEDVKLILSGGRLDRPTVGDLLAAEQAKHAEDGNKRTQEHSVG